MAELCLFKNKLWPKKSRGSFSLSRLESILLGTHKNHLFFGSLTGAVIGTRWWAGRDNAILTEPAPSHTNCLKTRRLPPAVPEPVEGSGARCVSQPCNYKHITGSEVLADELPQNHS